MSTPIQNRYDFVYLFDVTNGNPNGDPDAGNSPRMDPMTNHGFVSDVCLKRKIRNFITQVKSNGEGQPDDGYDIYVKEKAVLNRQHQRAHDAAGIKEQPEGAKKIEDARRWMCQTFFDIRMFGAVMTTGVNCGQVRGPVQFAFATSISPIFPLEQSITRMAVTTDREADSQEGGNRTMGRKEIIPYALYRAHGFINPFLAEQTGFSTDDLKLLWKALEQMFELDRSAARGEMSARRLFVFEHKSKLGDARAHQLFDLVQVTKKDGVEFPRSFSNYTVTAGDPPSGIRLEEFIK